ncbi:MAG: hypothetical protein WBK77_03270 [Alphaproteobacteria bacterium]
MTASMNVRITDIYNLSRQLSEKILPRDENLLGSLAEIRLSGGKNMVVGPYSFAGVVDDKNKTVFSFTPAERSHVAYFDNLFRALEQQGYKLNNLGEIGQHSTENYYPQRTNVNLALQFLTSTGVLSELEKIAQGNQHLKGGVLPREFTNAAKATNHSARIVKPELLALDAA